MRGDGGMVLAVTEAKEREREVLLENLRVFLDANEPLALRAVAAGPVGIELSYYVPRLDGPDEVPQERELVVLIQNAVRARLTGVPESFLVRAVVKWLSRMRPSVSGLSVSSGYDSVGVVAIELRVID